MHEFVALFLITSDTWVTVACSLVVAGVGILIHFRSAWRDRVDTKLKELEAREDFQNEHLIRHDRKFQCLRDKHNLDTPIHD